ncbi:hypothetical protein [Nocardia abscessus]|uniref:hypothetical protein n=1 Tax=Nocardia abscessus TaxID=120957 RepID=UPI001E4006EB|nr:hypothetical protein [Nocardia abscessus]
MDRARADGQLSEEEHDALTELAARTATAVRAESFGELDALIGDLQIPEELVNAPWSEWTGVVPGAGSRRSRPSSRLW